MSDQGRPAAPRSSWKTAEITGVVSALLGGLFAAFSAFDALTAAFLWIALILAILGMIFSGAAMFLAPRDAKTFVFYTGWGLIIGPASSSGSSRT